MSHHRETNPHFLPEDQQLHLLPHGREPRTQHVPFPPQPPRRHQSRQPRRSPTPYPYSLEQPQVPPQGHSPHSPHAAVQQHPHPQLDPHFPLHERPHELSTQDADPHRHLRDSTEHPASHSQPLHPTEHPALHRHPTDHPAPHRQPRDRTEHPAPHRNPRDRTELPVPLRHPRDRTEHPIPHRHPRDRTQHPTPHGRPPSSLRMPSGQKTRPHTWLIGVCCALFWVAVILTGLVVLIVYIVFRPRSPKFDIAGASLNAAYLDMGYLLNADINLLANFTNPSKKATVDFSNIVISIHYGNTLIATTYVEPFAAMKAESSFRNVHMVSSQVRLPVSEIVRLKQQVMQKNRVRFEVKAFLKTRSNLGSLFRYTYMLYGYCTIEVTGPPIGILVAKSCRTKR